ncbi:LapA family protein [Oharaeibacter diazotrophicus]|uniref:Uncharacterized protein DUF1049 n=2 Tax=Oharaeibacter diazotrophicus TaxID=1920512 RepID=A0A4R6R7E5_9HYPH|nr:LapA family protein [Oharaeibacter diazotrophicus]TDP81486.1 uncharacterized protein DUF1049 [Oharaeibacter diazotrophicus]BBE73724.1 hypothetical protein OHA_1_03340 [Pleomorphomonas sp. SM30]GLS75513.1 hypothetical protein GCM10007904_08480 [Oharaeibacter diazotrophicus]
MKSLVLLLVGGPVAVVLMAIAVVNNQPVTIAFDPFTPSTPFLALTVPLYVVFFGALLLGIALGGVATWARQGRFRKAARVNRREAARWRVEAERLKEVAAAPAPSGGTALPAPRRAA